MPQCRKKPAHLSDIRAGLCHSRFRSRKTSVRFHPQTERTLPASSAPGPWNVHVPMQSDPTRFRPDYTENKAHIARHDRLTRWDRSSIRSRVQNAPWDKCPSSLPCVLFSPVSLSRLSLFRDSRFCKTSFLERFLPSMKCPFLLRPGLLTI